MYAPSANPRVENEEDGIRWQPVGATINSTTLAYFALDQQSPMQHIFATALLAVLSGTLSAQSVFTTSGTFVVPAGVTSISVQLVGAGGSGGGNGGGGGGGGAFAAATLAVTPGASIPVVVGEGGSGVATILGGLGILAGAGGNGSSVPNPDLGGGGAGGVAQGGQMNRTGGAGGGGYWTYFGGGGGGAAGPLQNGSPGGNTIVWNGNNCLTPGGTGGTGGGAPGGDGGKGAGFVDVSCNVANPAGGGATYGGGGGGANGNSSPAGSGSGGVCIITWSPTSGVEDVVANVPVMLSNPFTDRIALRNTSGTERYTLLDAKGRTLWTGTHIEEQDFAELKAGAYVLGISVGSIVRTIKVVKQ